MKKKKINGIENCQVFLWLLTSAVVDVKIGFYIPSILSDKAIHVSFDQRLALPTC